MVERGWPAFNAKTCLYIAVPGIDIKIHRLDQSCDYKGAYLNREKNDFPSYADRSQNINAERCAKGVNCITESINIHFWSEHRRLRIQNKLEPVVAKIKIILFKVAVVGFRPMFSLRRGIAVLE
jgi:hypothetical protein